MAKNRSRRILNGVQTTSRFENFFPQGGEGHAPRTVVRQRQCPSIVLLTSKNSKIVGDLLVGLWDIFLKGVRVGLEN